MQTLSREQLLEIARRVAETFDRPKRWHQGGWGRDDDGYTLSFDGHFHVEDQDGNHRTKTATIIPLLYGCARPTLPAASAAAPPSASIPATSPASTPRASAT